jgi:hypothetical protein
MSLEITGTSHDAATGRVLVTVALQDPGALSPDEQVAAITRVLGASVVRVKSSPLLEFYRCNIETTEGYTLLDIWNMDHDHLENKHNYIQWLFPLPEPSRFNPTAPVLTPDDIAAFHASPRLRGALLGSFELMLSFYGLDDTFSRLRLITATSAAHWLTRGNHNHLRLTRILGCLSLLGLRDHAKALYECLRDLADTPAGRRTITNETLEFWRAASERTV